MGAGEKEKEGAGGRLFSLPIVPRALAIIYWETSGSLDHDDRRILPSSQRALRLFRVVSGLW